jgi:signal transduction histidine kinase
VDEGQIQQVFSNLTINAIQATRDTGHLHVSLQNVNVSLDTIEGLEPGQYVKATVRDDGSGIEQKNLSRVFDPYFSTKPEGSGLGLATTYSIIVRHGGRISVESSPGEGTTFTLYLPAAGSRP